VGAVVAGARTVMAGGALRWLLCARGGVLVRGGCGAAAVMEARTMLQRLRFVSSVLVFAAAADGGGNGVCWMRLRLVVASEDGAEKTEAARCCCGGDGDARVKWRTRSRRRWCMVRWMMVARRCRCGGEKMVCDAKR